MTQVSSSLGAIPHRDRRRIGFGMFIGGVCVVCACIAIRYYWGAEPVSAEAPRPPLSRKASDTAKVPARRGAGAQKSRAESQPSSPGGGSAESRLKVVAMVNGQPISRQDLARECLRHYGKDVLERLVNKWLIAQACLRQNIAVTRVEVDAEIERMSKRFSLPVAQWLKMLKEERGIEPEQYANDIIWPTLALRKLAGDRTKVSREELLQEFETRYGEAVRVRLISFTDLDAAEKTRGEAVADPNNFGNLAKDRSEDVSASVKGLVQPIRKHASSRQIEHAAFTMRDGQVSPVMQVAGKYMIMKRECMLPASKVKFEQVASRMEEVVRERKMRTAAHEIFRELQDGVEMVNVLNDPLKRREMPGVAAIINGHKITIRELAEQCIKRHGKEVLEGTINHMLIEQACAKRKITIAEEEIDREIVRAASEGVKPKPDGSPDVETWLKLVTEQQGVSLDVYRSASVRPSLALKKLADGKVKVTEADIQKSYEATFGPRVRCRAIVLDDLRRAQQVWENARGNPTVEHFGKLAKQYSVEATSRALEGQIPPIKNHGGQPIIEKEAFNLANGELSGIIQLGQKYVILFCEGRTKPVSVDPATVRKELHRDIFEKKQRLAMAKYFRQLQKNASIDNFLAGSSRSPKKKGSGGMKSLPGVPTLRQVPGRG